MAVNPNLTSKHHNVREILNCRYHGTVYENDEFTLATGQTDYDVKTGQSNFSAVPVASLVNIRTDRDLTIKLNSTDNNGITVTSTDSPFEIDYLEVTNIYITNASGNTANIKILLV